MRIANPQGSGVRVVYLAISGVLHPSESTYALVHGRSPWADGHTPYEGVEVLQRALAPWPDVRVILTSQLPRQNELVVRRTTFADLTTRAKRELATRRGTTRVTSISADDYWRMSKSEVVLTHVAWLQPRAWVAIDDEDALWPAVLRRDQVVLTDSCVGLRDSATIDRLHTVLAGNFGSTLPRTLSD